MYKTSREYIEKNYEKATKDTVITDDQKKTLDLLNYWVAELSEKNKIVPPEIKVTFCNLPENTRAKTCYFYDEGFALIKINNSSISDSFIERTIVHEVSHVLQFAQSDRDNTEITKNKHNIAWKKIFKTSGMQTNYNFDIYA